MKYHYNPLTASVGSSPEKKFKTEFFDCEYDSTNPSDLIVSVPHALRSKQHQRKLEADVKAEEYECLDHIDLTDEPDNVKETCSTKSSEGDDDDDDEDDTDDVVIDTSSSIQIEDDTTMVKLGFRNKTAVPRELWEKNTIALFQYAKNELEKLIFNPAAGGIRLFVPRFRSISLAGKVILVNCYCEGTKSWLENVVNNEQRLRDFLYVIKLEAPPISKELKETCEYNVNEHAFKVTVNAVRLGNRAPANIKILKRFSRQNPNISTDSWCIYKRVHRFTLSTELLTLYISMDHCAANCLSNVDYRLYYGMEKVPFVYLNPIKQEYN